VAEPSVSKQAELTCWATDRQIGIGAI